MPDRVDRYIGSSLLRENALGRAAVSDEVPIAADTGQKHGVDPSLRLFAVTVAVSEGEYALLDEALLDWLQRPRRDLQFPTP